MNNTETPQSIDEKIDEWHDSDSELSLCEYLGMTMQEYVAFVMSKEGGNTPINMIPDEITQHQSAEWIRSRNETSIPVWKIWKAAIEWYETLPKPKPEHTKPADLLSPLTTESLQIYINWTQGRGMFDNENEALHIEMSKRVKGLFGATL